MNLFDNTGQDRVVFKQIDDIVELLKTLLHQDLLGLYLYGSATHKGIQKYSDIDLLALTTRKFTTEEQEIFIKKMLQISKDPKKGGGFPIELTIVENSQISPWNYPPKFAFQFGEWMREDFENKKENLQSSNEMPDLAVLITLVHLSGKTIAGLDPKQALPQVPYLDFMHALQENIPSLLKALHTDTRNVLLTLARVWATFYTDTISSKTDSANWAIEQLPESLIEPMERARKISLGSHEDDLTDLKHQLKPLVDFIKQAIHTRYKNLKMENLGERKVTLKF